MELTSCYLEITALSILHQIDQDQLSTGYAHSTASLYKTLASWGRVDNWRFVLGGFTWD